MGVIYEVKSSEEEKAKMGLQTPFREKTIRELAVAALAISREGLNARARLNGHGENETVFLQELDSFAKTGKSNADRLIEKFQSDWDGDIMRAYEDCIY